MKIRYALPALLAIPMFGLSMMAANYLAASWFAIAIFMSLEADFTEFCRENDL